MYFAYQKRFMLLLGAAVTTFSNAK
jgi:hypothetical protein